LEARDNLTGYARVRYNTATTNAQQGLIDYAQELQEDDLHTRMPDIVKKSGWKRQFKSHDKTQKRLMTGAEAAERDVNHREQAAAQEARFESRDDWLLRRAEPTPSSLPSTEVERVPDTPPRRAIMAASLLPSSQLGLDIEEKEERAEEERAEEEEEEEEEEKEEEKEEEEEEEEDVFIPPPSTAPMILSRAGRKRAPTMKALEAEKASKRGTGQGRAGRGRGGGGRGVRQGQRQ